MIRQESDKVRTKFTFRFETPGEKVEETESKTKTTKRDKSSKRTYLT